MSDKEQIAILKTALRQAALDIMNLGAFLRLEGHPDLADISTKMHAAALAALVEDSPREKRSMSFTEAVKHAEATGRPVRQKSWNSQWKVWVTKPAATSPSYRYISLDGSDSGVREYEPSYSDIVSDEWEEVESL